MGGFAQIPTIEQTVPVQDVPPRFARIAPQIPAPEAKAQAQIGEGLGKLGEILAVQYQHKQILDADTVTNGVRTGLTTTLAAVKQLPGDRQADAFQNGFDQADGTHVLGSKEILQKALQDPQNQHIVHYLQNQLPKQAGLYQDEAIRAGAEATMVEHHQQVVFNGKQTANLSGANYTVDAKGNFTDGPSAQAAEQNYLTQVHSIYGNNPTVENEIITGYNQAKIQKRMQSVAVNNPDQIGKYIASLQPGMVDGQQQMAAISLATNTMNQAHKQLDINFGQAEAAEDAYQARYAQQNGHADLPHLAASHNSGAASDRLYEKWANKPYEIQTLPSTAGAIENRIKNLNSLDDANMLKADLQAEEDHKNLSPGDKVRYDALVAHSIEQMKTPAGQARITAGNQVKQNYFVASHEDQRYEDRHKGSFAQAAAKAVGIYQASIYGHPAEPPQFYFDKMQAAIKAVPRPGADAAAKPVPPPPPVSDAVAAAVADYNKRHPGEAIGK